MLADKEAVAPDFDGFGKNGLWRRENTQLNFEMRSFVFSDGREAIIVESGRARCLRDGAIDRGSRKNIADTAAQLAAQIERSESAPRLG